MCLINLHKLYDISLHIHSAETVAPTFQFHQKILSVVRCLEASFGIQTWKSKQNRGCEVWSLDIQMVSRGSSFKTFPAFLSTVCSFGHYSLFHLYSGIIVPFLPCKSILMRTLCLENFLAKVYLLSIFSLSSMRLKDPSIGKSEF